MLRCVQTAQKNMNSAPSSFKTKAEFRLIEKITSSRSEDDKSRVYSTKKFFEEIKEVRLPRVKPVARDLERDCEGGIPSAPREYLGYLILIGVDSTTVEKLRAGRENRERETHARFFTPLATVSASSL
jgi:hypothetical protein